MHVGARCSRLAGPLLLALLLAATAASDAATHETPPAALDGTAAAAAAGTAPNAPPSMRERGQQSLPFRRAISLAPHITELIYAAGAGGHIVGTVSRSDYPPDARSIARLGDGVAVSAEATLALHPDVVIAWHDSGAARRLSPVLQRNRIPLRLSDPASLDDIAREIQHMGKLFGTQATARKASLALSDRIDTLRKRYARRRPMTVYIEISHPPLFALARDSAINDALRVCGGSNVFADLPTASSQIGPEGVLLRQPEVVIAPYQNPEEVAALRERWARLGLSAAVRGQVYGVNPDELFRPGPRLVDAAERICAILDQARGAGR